MGRRRSSGNLGVWNANGELESRRRGLETARGIFGAIAMEVEIQLPSKLSWRRLLRYQHHQIAPGGRSLTV